MFTFCWHVLKTSQNSCELGRKRLIGGATNNFIGGATQKMVGGATNKNSNNEISSGWRPPTISL